MFDFRVAMMWLMFVEIPNIFQHLSTSVNYDLDELVDLRWDHCECLWFSRCEASQLQMTGKLALPIDKQSRINRQNTHFVSVLGGSSYL